MPADRKLQSLRSQLTIGASPAHVAVHLADQTLSGEQSMGLLEASQTAETVDELELALKDLRTGGIQTTTEIVGPEGAISQAFASQP